MRRETVKLYKHELMINSCLNNSTIDFIFNLKYLKL